MKPVERKEENEMRFKPRSTIPGRELLIDLNHNVNKIDQTVSKYMHEGMVRAGYIKNYR